MYNFYRRSWIVGRLNKMSEDTFGGPPIVLPMPYKDSLGADAADGVRPRAGGQS